MRSKQKKILSQKDQKPAPKWYFLIVLLIPVFFFVLLELSLRIFNYGFDNRQWIGATENTLYLNPEIARRYFYTTERVPNSNGDIFDAVKKKNAFRIFVLGESSAAGYPFLPLGSFSHYIRKRLELIYPYRHIEMVNLGLTAINSYAIRDLLPGVLEQEPDLVLIYTGHNEYYGALGVGSMESLGTSRKLVNIMLSLNRFKTVELLRNTIQWIMKLFSEQEKRSGTLMSRIAKEQYIEYQSDTYYSGISQFEGNMRDILEMLKEHNIPVIISTLTSNLKDQPPFIPLKSKDIPSADEVFSKAETELDSGNLLKADSLFRFAKDLDGLRFRAPEQFNKIIKSLGEEFNYPVINTDSAFASVSPYGITGNNLMTDHLHPTLQGYQLIGRLFFNKMKEKNFLPDAEPVDIPDNQQDSIAVADYEFTPLDSVMSDYKIRLLKNDWPFADKENKIPASVLLNRKNAVDSLAGQVINDEISWEEAHRRMAAIYLSQGKMHSFLAEMDVLITQYPIVVEYYDYVANVLLQLKDYKRAYKYLKTGYDIQPNAFKTKWLGTINLYDNKLDSALTFLNESLLYDSKDAQVWYNLAGVYVKLKNYVKALEYVDKSLSLKPDYPEAASLQQQLRNAVR